MSNAVPSSKPRSSVNVKHTRRSLSKSGVLNLLLRDPPPSKDEVSAYKTEVRALPTPSMGLFVNAKGDYRASPYWSSGQVSTGLDRELHLVKVMEGSVSGQDGWSSLIIDKYTNLDKVAGALDYEVDRVRTIVDRARERSFVSQDPETGMRVEGRVCPSVWDTLDDERATEYLCTEATLGLGAIWRARQKTEEGAASSQRLTELEDFVHRALEIESKALAPSTSCADFLPITTDADFVSVSRACGTEFEDMMPILLEKRQDLVDTCKKAAQFSHYGWRLVLPKPFEACSEVSQSELDSATKQLASDVSAGLGGVWRSEQMEAATKRALERVEAAKMLAIRRKCDELSARMKGGSSAKSRGS